MVFETVNGNSYFFDSSNGNNMFLHPDLLRILKSDLIGHQDLHYYNSKFEWLKKNGLLLADFIPSLGNNLTDNDVCDFFFSADHICFEVTENCNLGCRYCAYRDVYENQIVRNNDSISFELVERFVKFYLEKEIHRPKLNVSFYGGEPLLNYSLIEQVVRLILDHPKKPDVVSFSMTTNGTLLDRHIDYLVKHDFRLNISLDGDSSNNGYRVYVDGKDSFENVYRNVCLVRDVYPEYFKNKVGFMSVLHSKNSVNDLVTFFETQFGKESRISEVSPVDVSSEKVDSFNQLYKNYFDSLEDGGCEGLIKAKEKMEEQMISSFIRGNSNLVFHKYLNLIKSSSFGKFPTATCLPFTRKIFLTAKGHILPCERIGMGHSFGVVNSHDVAIDFLAIAEFYNKHYEVIKKQCIKCARLFNCNQCMLYNGIHKDENYQCAGFYSIKMQEAYLSRIFRTLENKPDLYKKIIDEYVYE